MALHCPISGVTRTPTDTVRAQPRRGAPERCPRPLPSPPLLGALASSPAPSRLRLHPAPAAAQPEPLAGAGWVAVTTVRSQARWPRARRGGERAPRACGRAGRWAGHRPGPGQGRGRGGQANRRPGVDGSSRDPELNRRQDAPEAGEPHGPSRSPAAFPRGRDDPPERRPRGWRGRAAQGGGERRAAVLSCIHQQPGIQGTAHLPEGTQTHLSVHLFPFRLALGPGARTRP